MNGERGMEWEFCCLFEEMTMKGLKDEGTLVFLSTACCDGRRGPAGVKVIYFWLLGFLMQIFELGCNMMHASTSMQNKMNAIALTSLSHASLRQSEFPICP